MAPTLDSSCTTPTVILWIMRLDTLSLVALGAMALLSSGCGDSEGLRPVLESEVPTTTTKPIVVYSEEGDGPKYGHDPTPRSASVKHSNGRGAGGAGSPLRW